MAGTLRIQKQSITEMDVDCIVNAANSQLRHGGGVCGAIFAAAGASQLQAACDALGHCPTGEAVITPGFKLKAKYIVHAVGPIWQGGSHNEEKPTWKRRMSRRSTSVSASYSAISAFSLEPT